MESVGGAGRPLAAEEEELKRNTDCVYFLASPLTCKKGMECEFRHSDVARLNPRGCRYWLSGNCLNAKCPFRHPPLLDGPPSPAPQVAAPVQALALQTSAYNSNKQSVPCYYFQKGHCLKGDRCPFMHWPQPIGNPQPSTKASTASADSSQMIKDLWAVKECTSQSNTPKINVDRPVELSSSSANLALKPETANNGQTMARKFPYQPPADMRPRAQVMKVPNHQSENAHPRQVTKFPNHPSDNVHPRAQPTKVSVGSSVDLSRPRNFQSHPVTEQLKKGGESTQFLEMSSPAFNLPGENNAEDSGHFDNNNDHARKSVQGRRKLDHVDGFSYQHRDHKPAKEFERDQLNKMREYSQHERQSDAYSLDQQNFSERIVGRTYTIDRRVLQRKDGIEETDKSDLRHQLLKQRKLNSSRTAVSTVCRGGTHQRNDHYAEERYRQHTLQGDLPDYHLQSSISNRLRGRITNPIRLSPDRSIDVRAERERERRQLQSRLSPVRPSSHQGRHHDGTKQKLDEILPSDGRSFGDKSVRIEAPDSLDFAGPKSLAELKGAKVSESAQGRQPIKRTNACASHEHKGGNLEKLTGDQEPEASLSFEGPKPLSTILKRKREAASENGASSSSRDELNLSDQEVLNGNSVTVVIPNMQFDPVHNSEEPGDKMVDNDYEEEEDEEGQICADNGELIGGQYSAKEMPECLGVMGEAIDEQAQENSDAGESIKAAGFKTEDDEDDTYQDADYEDMDDEDDFARKVGLMFS